MARVDYKAVVEATKSIYGVTRKEIAETIGCSTGYLNIISCGKTPSDKFKRKWAECYPNIAGMLIIKSEATANENVVAPVVEHKKRGRKPKNEIQEATITPHVDVVPTEAETKPSEWLEDVTHEESKPTEVKNESTKELVKVGENNNVEFFNAQMKKKDERIEWLELLNQDKDKELNELKTKYHELSVINSKLVMQFAEKFGM
jgi:hypothetical protein